MIEIFHVSDLHFEKSPKRTKRAQLLLDKIKKKFEIGEAENRYLLVTGDIVENGEKREYSIARNALLPFKDKVYVAPGNHDYGWMGAAYSDKVAKRFDSDLASKIGISHPFFPKTPPYTDVVSDGQGNKVLLIGLNSCSKTDFLGGFSDLAEGEIEDFQRRALARILNNPEYRNIPKIVFLHHIPHRRAKGIFMSLRDWKELMAIVRGKVEVMAFGHEGKMKGVKQQIVKKLKMAKQDLRRLLDYRKASGPIRGMKLRRGKGQKIRYYLDANKSVKEQACYRIKIDGNKVLARLVKLA